MERPPFYREVLGFLLAPLVVATPLAIFYGGVGWHVFAPIGVAASLLFGVPAYVLVLRLKRLGVVSCLVGGFMCGAATVAVLLLLFAASTPTSPTLSGYFSLSGLRLSWSIIVKEIVLILAVGGIVGLIVGAAFWVIAVAGTGAVSNVKT